MALSAVLVHGYHAYLLALAFDVKEIIVGLVITHCAVMSVIYNSRLAWASPANIPAWIAKRVADSTLPDETSSGERAKKKK